MLFLVLYCISITKKSAISVTVIYHAMSLSMLYQYHSEESYFYHSDLSCYVSWYAVSVSLRRVIFLSQWFTMLCLWLCCVSITKKSVFFLSQWFIMLCLLECCINITQKSDISVTVVYHAMSLTLLCQYY
jgi:hypothetical protein